MAHMGKARGGQLDTLEMLARRTGFADSSASMRAVCGRLGVPVAVDASGAPAAPVAPFVVAGPSAAR